MMKLWLSLLLVVCLLSPCVGQEPAPPGVERMKLTMNAPKPATFGEYSHLTIWFSGQKDKLYKVRIDWNNGSGVHEIQFMMDPAIELDVPLAVLQDTEWWFPKRAEYDAFVKAYRWNKDTRKWDLLGSDSAQWPPPADDGGETP